MKPKRSFFPRIRSLINLFVQKVNASCLVSCHPHIYTYLRPPFCRSFPPYEKTLPTSRPPSPPNNLLTPPMSSSLNLLALLLLLPPSTLSLNFLPDFLQSPESNRNLGQQYPSKYPPCATSADCMLEDPSNILQQYGGEYFCAAEVRGHMGLGHEHRIGKIYISSFLVDLTTENATAGLNSDVP